MIFQIGINRTVILGVEIQSGTNPTILSKGFGVKEKIADRLFDFPAQGRLALMFLKNYSGISAGIISNQFCSVKELGGVRAYSISKQSV